MMRSNGQKLGPLRENAASGRLLLAALVDSGSRRHNVTRSIEHDHVRARKNSRASAGGIELLVSG
jgi:hypothetical protein